MKTQVVILSVTDLHCERIVPVQRFFERMLSKVRGTSPDPEYHVVFFGRTNFTIPASQSFGNITLQGEEFNLYGEAFPYEPGKGQFWKFSAIENIGRVIHEHEILKMQFTIE